MIPKLKDFLDLLEQIAPARLAEQWDNPGLQVGSYDQEIRKIFLALDPTSEALGSASKTGAQVLLTHHPLIFKPISRLEIHSYPQNVIFQATKNRISVVAAHTNLDVAKGGMNDILAHILGLQQIEVLSKTDEDKDVGLGRIGDLPGPTEFSCVVDHIKKALRTEKIRLAGHADSPVRRLAVVAGSGGGFVPLAYEKGADLLLTGDVSHHHALEARALGITLIDGGHFHTEKAAFRTFAERLGDVITGKGWDVTVEVYADETSPIHDS
jgi:dinuclear metal center YbgI/SA1388 family protein